MKVYYLHFDRSNTYISRDEDTGLVTFTTDNIDLYQNDSYTNYSYTKSNYGLNSLGNNTWTGLTEFSGTTTDSGIIEGGRFIDTTGRIDLTGHSLTFSNPVLTAGSLGSNDISVLVNIYGIDDNEIPDDQWGQLDNITLDRYILWVNSYRYVRFELLCTTGYDLSEAEFTYDVRVEIDKPVMAPLYAKTRSILNQFPEWMAISSEAIPAATPALTAPDSLGAQLLNAVSGEWLDLISKDLTSLAMQRYISTADLSQVAWIYFTNILDDIVYSVKATDVSASPATDELIRLSPAADLREFYEADEDAAIFWWDQYKHAIYTRQQYDVLLVNDVICESQLQPVWNWFDEHGAIVDLKRHAGEDNLTFRSRILDVYLNAPGVSINSFKNALRRELNLWKAFDSSATPDSSTPISLPTVLEMADMESMEEFMAPDGLPTQKFIDLVQDLAVEYPITWGFFIWGHALWDIGGEENQGFGVLPYRYDATPVSEEETQAGVGGGLDLFVYHPDEVTGPVDFSYRIIVRGRERSTREEYPEVKVYCEIYGRAEKEIWDNPVLTPYFTFVATVDGITYYLSVQATVQSDVNNDTPLPTPNSYYSYDILGPDGLIRSDQIWYDETGNEFSTDTASPFALDLESASDIHVQWGRFDPDTQTFTDYPADNTADLWFAYENSTLNYLSANNDDLQIVPDSIELSPSYASILIVSNATSSSTDYWTSDPQPFVVKVNGALPGNAQRDTTHRAPFILWDPYIDEGTKKYAIQLTLTDPHTNPDRVEYVVETHNEDGDKIYLKSSRLDINDLHNWSNDGLLILNDADDVEELVFHIRESINPDYPVLRSAWETFTAGERDWRTGIVDENGPWRMGYPQEKGAFNFLLDDLTLDRDDLYLSSNSKYVITWIGVLTKDSDVIVWLDSNVVVSATDDTFLEIDYPDNAVIESEDKVLGPFFVRARLRPETKPEWNPKLHSGWFYEGQKEYYLYADKQHDTTSGDRAILDEVSRQGAPIMIKTTDATPIEFRQVTFFDEATPVLRELNTEILRGTDTYELYAAYYGLLKIEVIDLLTGISIPCYRSSDTNVITLSQIVHKDRDYEVTYYVNYSFFADHEFEFKKQNKTAIHLMASPSYDSVNIVYEGSEFDPATPISLPLNPLYTALDEGFIFISHQEYDLEYVQAFLSPSKLVADGEDYSLLTIRSLDQYSNPKPNQSFTVTTTFGTFEETEADSLELTTDRDGFAKAILISAASTSDLNGYIAIDGPGVVDATVRYEIQPYIQKGYRLLAVPSVDSIPADEGESSIYVYGKVEDDQYSPVQYATVAWKRHRSMSEVFQDDYQGQVIANEDGIFAIGPIESATPATPGYWFMVVESWNQGASPSGPVATPDYDATPYSTPSYGPIGDVVFWNEYPDIRYGANEANELPLRTMQTEVNSFESVYYSNQRAFPLTYDDATPYADATPTPTFEYQAPQWYAIQRYLQYQLGLLGDDFYTVDIDALSDAPPDYKDI